MEFCWCTETIIFAIGVFLVLTHGFLLIREHWQAIRACMVRCANFLWTSPSWMHYCVKLCQCHCSSESSLADALLTQHVAQRRLEVMSNTLMTVSGILSVSTIGILMRIMLQMEGGSVPQVISTFVALSVSMCASYVFSLTAELLEFFYGTIMIAASFYIWNAPPSNFVLSVSLSFVGQLVLSINFMNIRSVLLWNLSVLGTSVVYAVREPSPILTPGIIYLFLIVLFTIIVVAAVGMKLSAMSSARQQMHICSLKTENSASFSLLDLVCDVVVKLDSKLNINHDSRTFKAMLMKTGGTTTEGVPFTHFITDDQERQNFERHLLTARTASESKVGTFRTTFTDSLRNRVNADIFFVHVQMDFDMTHFLLGIRECNEVEGQTVNLVKTPSPLPKERKKVTSSSHEGTSKISPHIDSPQMDPVGSLSPALESDGASSTSGSSQEGDQNGPGFRNLASISFVLNILDRTLPIVEANIKFRGHDENSVGEQSPALSACLSSSRLRSFDDWLQAAANALMYGKDAPSYGGITFKHPGLPSMSARRAYADDVEEDTVRVRFEDVSLRLPNVHQRRKRSSQYYHLASRTAPNAGSEGVPIGRSDLSNTQPPERVML
eukprot:TRINITY_DN2755_c1_g3_i1.p1 TRINITY_DN2755_c1_g3~~TRINITY_DN2755_c1_g3_i1.p1  ORF type:complete len:609 (-),score=54.42 TRINITY_DN2755_c1_g3_i1:330-2156(-)